MHLPHHHVRLSPPASEVRRAYFLIRWYKRTEAQKRFTAFLSSTTLAATFGGLIAYAIAKLDGKAGLSSWRWVFVVGVFFVPPSTVGH